MIKRVTIYGDSFADPHGDPGFFPTWHSRLKDRWPETVNHAECAAGPMYSFKQFYQDLPKLNYEDLIVFVISGAPRIYFDIKEVSNEDIHRWNENICRKVMDKTHRPNPRSTNCNNWMTLNLDKARYAIDTFSNETLAVSTWKYESLLYTSSRIQKCKVFIWHLSFDGCPAPSFPHSHQHRKSSFIKTSLNDDHFYVHNESLVEASSNEYVEAASEKRDNEIDRKLNRLSAETCPRVNHLTEVNHEIMYKQIEGFVDGKEIPKFLKGVYKCDQLRGCFNLHQDQKTDEFIYD